MASRVTHACHCLTFLLSGQSLWGQWGQSCWQTCTGPCWRSGNSSQSIAKNWGLVSQKETSWTPLVLQAQNVSSAQLFCNRFYLRREKEKLVTWHNNIVFKDSDNVARQALLSLPWISSLLLLTSIQTSDIVLWAQVHFLKYNRI